MSKDLDGWKIEGPRAFDGRCGASMEVEDYDEEEVNEVFVNHDQLGITFGFERHRRVSLAVVREVIRLYDEGKAGASPKERR